MDFYASGDALAVVDSINGVRVGTERGADLQLVRMWVGHCPLPATQDVIGRQSGAGNVGVCGLFR